MSVHFRFPVPVCDKGRYCVDMSKPTPKHCPTCTGSLSVEQNQGSRISRIRSHAPALVLLHRYWGSSLLALSCRRDVGHAAIASCRCHVSRHGLSENQVDMADRFKRAQQPRPSYGQQPGPGQSL